MTGDRSVRRRGRPGTEIEIVDSKTERNKTGGRKSVGSEVSPEEKT